MWNGASQVSSHNAARTGFGIPVPSGRFSEGGGAVLYDSVHCMETEYSCVVYCYATYYGDLIGGGGTARVVCEEVVVRTGVLLPRGDVDVILITGTLIKGGGRGWGGDRGIL